MKLKYFLIVSFLLITSINFSQSQEYIDSLKNELLEAKEDTVKIELRYQIGSATRTFRIPYWDSIVYDANKFGMPQVEAESLNNIGFIYNMQGNPDSCLLYFHKSLEISQKTGDKAIIANSYNSIGHVLKAQGKITEALIHFHMGLKLLEEIGEKQGEASLLNNIGAIHNDQGDLKKAESFYRRSLVIRREIGDNYGIATCLNNLGNYYADIAVNLADIERDSLNKLGLEYYFESLKIRKEIGDQQMLPNSLNNIAAMYFEISKYAKVGSKKDSLEGMAFSYYEKALAASKVIESKKWETFALNGMAQLFLSKREITKAKSVALLSYKISNELGYPLRIKESAALLSEIYTKERNFEKALEMFAIQVQMRDSISNSNNEKTTIQLQAKYEYEKKSATDSIANLETHKVLEAQIAAEEANTAKERQGKYFLYGGLGLLAVFGVFIFNRLNMSQKQNKLIQEQNGEITEQKILIEEKNKEVMDSILYAKRLQQAILPSRKELKNELKNGFVLFEPKDVVSGDFYWMDTSNTQNDTVLFAAADCTGHGVPGAMVSVVCSNALDRAVKEFRLTNPGEILDKVTDLVIERFEKSGEEVKDGMDIALCSIDFKNRKLQYSGANNPLWIIKKRLGDEQFESRDVFNDTHYVKEYKATKQPVGKYALRSKFKVIDVQIDEGDVFYVFTDGLVDQFGGKKGKKFKHKPFKKLLLDITSKEMDKQKSMISEIFSDWKGDLEQIDDVCVIGVRL